MYMLNTPIEDTTPLPDPATVLNNLKNNLQHNPQNRAISNDSLSSIFTNQINDVISFVNGILVESAKLNASDILFEPEEKDIRVRIRVDGVLYVVGRVPKSTIDKIIARIKVISNLDITEKRRVQEGQFSTNIEGNIINYRVEIVQVIHGELVIIRILQRDSIVMTLESLGFNCQQLTQFKEILSSKSGLILVCGPTGSGKTTTLYTTIAELNKSQEYNVITIEDPVEYKLAGVNQMPIKLDMGFTFEEGLRVTLRLSPDIILVGEIRDKETATIAVESGLTGHMVLSTIHAPDSIGVIYRLLEYDIDTYLINNALRGVISQRLVRRNCPKCIQPYTPTQDEIALFQKYLRRVPKELYKSTGCLECQNLGYKGRIGIYEILKVDSSIRSFVRDGISEDVLRQKLDEMNFINLIRDGLLKCEQGLTTCDEVFRNSIFSS